MENDKQSILEKIKSILNFDKETEIEVDTTEVSGELNFKDVKDKDGRLIRIDGELIEGVMISLINEDGTLSPLANEEIVIDGTVIKTGEDSKITEIVTGVEEDENMEDEEEKPEDFVEDEIPAEIETPVEDENNTEDSIASLSNRLDALEEMIKEVVSKQETGEEVDFLMAEALEKFSKEPSDDLIEKIKTNFNKTNPIVNNSPEALKQRNLESIRQLRSKK